MQKQVEENSIQVKFCCFKKSNPTGFCIFHLPANGLLIHSSISVLQVECMENIWFDED